MYWEENVIKLLCVGRKKSITLQWKKNIFSMYFYAIAYIAGQAECCRTLISMKYKRKKKSSKKYGREKKRIFIAEISDAGKICYQNQLFITK